MPDSTDRRVPDPREDDIFSVVCGLLPALWLPAGCFFVGAYLYAIAGRLTYPYPLEWLEPDTLDIVSRILAGLPVYSEPTYAYVPSMKTPLYDYVVAAFSLMLGNGFVAGRLVSILSITGVCILIWNFVRREGGASAWAFFGVALFLATYHLSLEWYDIARLDSLFLLLAVAGAFALRFSRGAVGAATAGLIFALAFFTKQAILLLIIPALFLYALVEPKRAMIASLTAAALVVAGMAIFHAATDGWSTFFLIEVPRHAVIEPDRIARFWTADVMAPLFLALLTATALIVAKWRSDRAGALFYGGLLGGALLTGWVGRANIAGSPNVLMPAYAVLAVTMPLALQAMLRVSSGWGRRGQALCVAVHLIALVQLLVLFYDPRSVIPTSSDQALSDQVLARLRSIDGGILTMDDRYFVRLLAKPSAGLDYSLIDVLNDQNSPVTATLKESIVGALRARQFAGVVDPPAFIRDALDLAAPVNLQSTPAAQRDRFTPRPQLYYPLAK